MKSRKRAIYAGVVGAGLLALVVDRLLPAGDVSGPAEAVAAADPGRSASAPVSENPMPPVVASPFPASLKPQPGPIRDLFAMSTAVRERLESEAEGSASAASAVRRPGARPRAAEFKSAHRLSAVLSDGRTQIAILDGRWVREGEKIDGCPLQRVDGQTAWFDCADGQAEMVIGGAQP